MQNGFEIQKSNSQLIEDFAAGIEHTQAPPPKLRNWVQLSPDPWVSSSGHATTKVHSSFWRASGSELGPVIPWLKQWTQSSLHAPDLVNCPHPQLTLEIHKPIKLKSPIQRVMVVTSDEGVDQLISSSQLSTNILKLLVGALLLPRKWFDRFGTPTEARPPLPDTTSYPTPTLSPLSIITIDYQSGKVISGEGINQRGTSLDTTSLLPEVLCRGFTNAWNAGLGFNRFRPPLWE